jgi:hypothetical protein
MVDPTSVYIRLQSSQDNHYSDTLSTNRLLTEATALWDSIIHFHTGLWKEQESLSPTNRMIEQKNKSGVPQLDPSNVLQSKRTPVSGNDIIQLGRLVHQVLPEGSEATDMLKTLLKSYAGNSIRSVRTVIDGLIDGLIRGRRFLGYGEPSVDESKPLSEGSSSCLLLTTNSSTEGGAKSGNKLRCEYQVSGSCQIWMTPHETLEHFVEHFLGQSYPWNCPSWYVELIYDYLPPYPSLGAYLP